MHTSVDHSRQALLPVCKSAPGGMMRFEAGLLAMARSLDQFPRRTGRSAVREGGGSLEIVQRLAMHVIVPFGAQRV